MRIVRVSPEGAATLAGAAASALGLVWVLYERVLPFTGVLGFWLCWYVAFLLLYAVMARMQWDWRDVVNKVMAVALATGGALVLAVVLGTDLYTLVRGAARGRARSTSGTQSMAFAGPTSALDIGGARTPPSAPWNRSPSAPCSRCRSRWRRPFSWPRWAARSRARSGSSSRR